MATEAGWATFAPRTAEDRKFVEFLQTKKKIPRVAVEHVTAGPAVSAIFDFLSSGTVPPPEQIYASEDPLAFEAIDRQWRALGRVIADWCLQYRCSGGVFLTGGVVDKAGPSA